MDDELDDLWRFGPTPEETAAVRAMVDLLDRTDHESMSRDDRRLLDHYRRQHAAASAAGVKARKERRSKAR